MKKTTYWAIKDNNSNHLFYNFHKDGVVKFSEINLARLFTRLIDAREVIKLIGQDCKVVQILRRTRINPDWDNNSKIILEIIHESDSIIIESEIDSVEELNTIISVRLKQKGWDFDNCSVKKIQI